MSQSVIIELEKLYKLFGPTPHLIMKDVHQGKTKAQLLGETGHTLGLRNINFSIYRGEIFVIMGLSGSGKSTLIRHFNRLIDPTEGCLRVNGEDIMALSEKELRTFRQQKMSMVFQRFALLPHYTVLENIAFGLETQGVNKKDRQGRAQQWLVDVGLTGYGSHYPAQLSGGQQQRVGLARALCTDAEILLMDEAFSALDPLIRSEMQDQLVELQEKLQKTIVFITHDLDEALRIGDRIAILRDGELVQVGKPEEILLNPADDYVEKFVRDVNRARALTVDTVMQPPSCRISADTIGEAVKQMKTFKSEYGFYVENGDFQGSILLEQLESAGPDKASQPVTDEYLHSNASISPGNLLEEVIPETLDNRYPLPVVDEEGVLTGELSRANIAEVLGNSDGSCP